MPRREQPLESGDEVLLRFARELRQLRKEAGNPTYRQLSSRAHYSTSTLSQAASGQKLPSLPVTLAYVAACDGDTVEWEARWREAAAGTATPEPDERAGECAPYVGLAAFQPDDADRFFGRDTLVADLLARVRAHRLLGVFGASGSGKSSVLRAGLVANLEPGTAVVLTPGAQPVEECAIHLASVLGRSPARLRAEFAADPRNLHLRIRQAMTAKAPGEDLVLVVDQFEEVFTLCAEDERAWLIDALTTAATATTSRARVVLGVRADFYGHCGQYPALAAALRDAQVLVGPMTADELRQAITEPAVRTGCRVETALVARLVSDATGQPAALPLVSHALLETWRRRHGATLTLSGYEAAGGIEHAVARTAEDVYAALDNDQQQVARQLFLRLTALGDGTEDTKRRIGRNHLDYPGTDELLRKLADARLVTLDRDSVELTHEALIRHWPRLRDWLTEDRDGLRLHRELTEATDAWEALDRDPGALYRGTRLARAHAWASTRNGALADRERTFLNTSLAVQTREQTAIVRSARRLRRLVALLAVLLLVATAATGYAIQAQRTATHQRNVAIVQNALREAGIMRISNFALAAQLTLAVHRLDPTPVTASNVLSMVGWSPGRQVVGFVDRVRSISSGSDGRTLIMATNDNIVRRWKAGPSDNFERLAQFDVDVGDSASRTPSARERDVAENRPPPPEPPQPSGHIDRATSVALSADGRRLATGSDDGTVRLWLTAGQGNPASIADFKFQTSLVFPLAFDPRDVLAIGVQDEVLLYDLSVSSEPVRISGQVGHVVTVAFGPGGLLAIAGNGRTVRLCDISDPENPRTVASLTDLPFVVTSAAFSSDGRMLATAGSDGSVQLWDLSDVDSPVLSATLPAELGAISAMAFGPGGRTLALAAGDNVVRLLETTVEQAAAKLCAAATGRRISHAEWERYFPGLDYRPPCG